MRFLAAVLVLSCFVPTAFAQNAPPALEALLPESDALAEHCIPRALDSAAPLFLTSNPQASDSVDFRSGLAEMAFLGDVPATHVERALIGAFAASHEVGMMAFRFTSEEAASRAANIARETEQAQVILTQGSVLAMVWRDGPPEACFETIVSHARDALRLE